MNYQIDGNKNSRWLIFSNSLGTEMSMWDQQVEALKNDFQILRYETGGKEAKSISDLGQNVLNLMDKLRISEAHFCGISLGGLIGQWLGIHHSARFLSLVLCNTSPKISTAEVWEQRILLVKQKGLIPVRDASPGRWFTSAFRIKEIDKVNKSLQGFSHLNADDYIGCCEILKTTNLWPEISKIKSKTLLIAGEFDEVTTVAEAKKMFEIIPSSKLEVLLAAHLSNIEAPGFSQLIMDFYKKTMTGNPA